MADRLIRALPPLANEWVHGLATTDPVDLAAGVALAEAVAGGAEVDEGLLGPLAAAVAAANSAHFRFDLAGLLDADEPRVVTLRPDDRTTALGLGLRGDRPTRKLLALQVVAVEGPTGTLVADPEAKSVELAVGTIVVLPAFCPASFVAAPGATATVVAVHALGPTFR